MYTTRTRSKDSRVNSYHIRVEIYDGVPTTMPTLIGTTGELRTISDNNHPNFRNIQKSGGIILSDCNLSVSNRSVTPCSLSSSRTDLPWSATCTGDGYGWFSGWPGVVDLDPYIMDSNALLIKAYAEMKRGAVMTGELLYELGETVAMLKHPFAGATKLLGQMAKMRSHLASSAKTAAKAASNAWLEYRYGWKPLILDGCEIIKECHKKRDKCERRRLIARAGSKGSKTKDLFKPADSGSARVFYFTGENTVKRDVGVIYDVVNTTTSDDLARSFSVRASDIPATIWELVPYSFVVDWFMNVGDWIQAVTPVPGLNVQGHWCSTSSNLKYTISGNIERRVNGPVTEMNGSLGSSTSTVGTFTRACNEPINFVPELTLKPLSILHQADAAGLLCQRLISDIRIFRH